MIPWFRLLCHISSLIVLRAFRPGPYPKGQWYSPHLPAQPQLSGGRCEHLCHFSVSACSCGKCIFRFIFFFFLPVMLPSEIPKFPTDTPMRGFPTVWKLFLLHDVVPKKGLHP